MDPPNVFSPPQTWQERAIKEFVADVYNEAEGDYYDIVDYCEMLEEALRARLQQRKRITQSNVDRLLKCWKWDIDLHGLRDSDYVE